MQGGNVTGGLGLDKEFFEPILVPQVMLYGFLGLWAGADGVTIDPHLPAGWKELTVTRVHLRDHILDIRVKPESIDITDHAPTGNQLPIRAGPGRKLKVIAQRAPQQAWPPARPGWHPIQSSHSMMYWDTPS